MGTRPPSRCAPPGHHGQVNSLWTAEETAPGTSARNPFPVGRDLHPGQIAGPSHRLKIFCLSKSKAKVSENKDPGVISRDQDMNHRVGSPSSSPDEVC